jgi:hypothetical protein
MTIPGPRFPTKAPEAQVAESGLIISAASPPNGEGTRWLNGIDYEPEGCVTGEPTDPCTVDEYLLTDQPPNVLWDPINLTLMTKCSSISSNEFEERQGRARRNLLNDQERQLGAELWDGDLAKLTPESERVNTWLADPESVSRLSVAAVGLVHGLACLDAYLTTNNGGQQGMIHATPQTFVHWASFRMLRWIGNRVLSPNGHLVVASPGYSGNSPEGLRASQNVWAYATDMVTVRLGEIKAYDLKDTIDRLNNDMYAIAERPAMAEWQRCRHAGIQLAVELCGDDYY